VTAGRGVVLTESYGARLRRLPRKLTYVVAIRSSIGQLLVNEACLSK